MKPIAVFYHCLFYLNGQPCDHACRIVQEQMNLADQSGLVAAASEIVVGVNGGEESRAAASCLPKKAQLVFHGLNSRSENLTLVELEKWVPAHSGWDVLYFHAKGCTSDNSGLSTRWRNCMMQNLVMNWTQCVSDLVSSYESVGCHWMPGVGNDRNDNIWAGNFWWATSDFLATVPSIFHRERIKVSGIASVESRYEAEVWLGNAPRLPRIKDYHPNGFGKCP